MEDDYSVVEDGGFEDDTNDSDYVYDPTDANEDEDEDDDVVEIVNIAASNGEFVAVDNKTKQSQSPKAIVQPAKDKGVKGNKKTRKKDLKDKDDNVGKSDPADAKEGEAADGSPLMPYSIFSSKGGGNAQYDEVPPLDLSGDECVTINFPVGRMQSQHRLYLEALQSAINKNWNAINTHPNSIDFALELGMKAARDELIGARTGIETRVTCESSEDDVYYTLESLNSNVERVNIYVVALEMIQTVSPNSTSNYFHTINYKVTDPSVFNNEKFAKVDFSLQLKFKLHSATGTACEEKGCNCHFHISAGDIIRVRRVKVKYKSDSNGFVHVNLYIIGKVTSVRLWNLERDEFNIIYNGVNTTITEYDLERVHTLKGFAKRILSENELLCVSSYMNSLDNITNMPQDYLCFVKYIERDSIYVIDRPDQAPIKVTFSLLIAKNVLESKNPISPGDWIKLRSFRGPMEPGKTLGPCLSCTEIGRVTRIWEGSKEVVTLKEHFAKSNEYFRADANLQSFRSIGMPSYTKRQRYSSRSGNLIDMVENTRPSLISEATKFSSVFPTDGVHQFPVKLTGLKRMNRTQTHELEEGEIVL